jgi:hypothetical protein
MPVIAHDLVAKDPAWIALQPFGENKLESVEVGGLFENRRLSIATVQGVLDAIRFIGSLWSWHARSLAGDQTRNNDS